MKKYMLSIILLPCSLFADDLPRCIDILVVKEEGDLIWRLPFTDDGIIDMIEAVAMLEGVYNKSPDNYSGHKLRKKFTKRIVHETPIIPYLCFYIALGASSCWLFTRKVWHVNFFRKCYIFCGIVAFFCWVSMPNVGYMPYADDYYNGQHCSFGNSKTVIFRSRDDRVAHEQIYTIIHETFKRSPAINTVQIGISGFYDFKEKNHLEQYWIKIPEDIGTFLRALNDVRPMTVLCLSRLNCKTFFEKLDTRSENLINLELWSSVLNSFTHYQLVNKIFLAFFIMGLFVTGFSFVIINIKHGYLNIWRYLFHVLFPIFYIVYGIQFVQEEIYMHYIRTRYISAGILSLILFVILLWISLES